MHRPLLCLAITLSLIQAKPTLAEAPPAFALKWGVHGTGPGQFDDAHDVQCDSQGNVYVADSGNYRIQKFSNNGDFIAELKSAPGGPAAFGKPPSCTVDLQGNVYVSDYAGGFIDVFDPNLAYVRRWSATAGYIRLSPDNSRLYSLEGDTLITYDVATGARVRHWRLTVQADLGFGVAPSGNLFFSGGTYIIQFTPEGSYLNYWGSFGAGDGQFVGGGGVTCDSEANVYGGDTTSRVQKFTSAGGFLSSWGSDGAADGQFRAFIPSIACDGAANVFVLDSGNWRVEKFSYGSTPTRASSWGALKRKFR